jgi:hypothetical protein
MPTLNLPTEDRRIESYSTAAPRDFVRSGRPFSRVAYAAAHVVADPLAACDPWLEPAIDWDRTIALDAARDVPGALIACGAGTDHLPVGNGVTVDDVIRAYEHQSEAIERLGGRIILMASRALAACAAGPDDYFRVYDRILSGMTSPVIIHWLGDMFDPALAGYWGHRDIPSAMETCLDILHAHADKIDGIKISLLDKEQEIKMRRRLPRGCRMYSGDDFSYPELIAGDKQGHTGNLRCHRPRGRGRSGQPAAQRAEHLP